MEQRELRELETKVQSSPPRLPLVSRQVAGQEAPLAQEAATTSLATAASSSPQTVHPAGETYARLQELATQGRGRTLGCNVG